MKTEKLYYENAYISSFSATVIDVQDMGGFYRIVLDRSAFFPKEGGQYADEGYIGDSRIYDVNEENGVIYHYTCDVPACVGATVECRIDFDSRYEKMRAHTAEHILSGIIYSRYGLNNVGFHLGNDYVTFDFDGTLTRAELDEAELEANRIISLNIPVRAYFPTQDVLVKLEYRSKLQDLQNVRIVEIGEYDRCACCAPHVNYTGEIGIVKLLDFERLRGGIRIYMQAGKGALLDYRERYSATKKISELLSVPQSEVAEAVARLCDELEAERSKSKSLSMRLAAEIAGRIQPTDVNAVENYPDFGMEELREAARVAVGRVGGMLVLLSGSDYNFKYVIASRHIDLKGCVKDINASLGGKGGGRSELIQGSFSSSLESIKAYFGV